MHFFVTAVAGLDEVAVFVLLASGDFARVARVVGRPHIAGDESLPPRDVQVPGEGGDGPDHVSQGLRISGDAAALCLAGDILICVK